MKIENNTNMQPNSQDCSINLQQDKFFNKLTDELKALQTQLFEVEKKVNARDTVIDTLDLSTQTLSVGESTETKDLYVNNNASIQGELSANKATIDTLTVLNDFITKLLHVTDLFANTADIEEADIRSAIIDVLKIKQAILRFDTNQEIVSFPSENVTQIGDIANSILLAGLERPTWNGDPIALTSDLSMGLTPNYKGTLNNEIELPPTATVGDFYLIKELMRSGQTGLGGAIYGINKTWEITLYYELLNYFNKDEINQLFDEELIDDIQRETDIIKGNTPVQVVANGCVMKRDDGTSDRLATAVDAFMLSGPEGMDNIARNSSLDDLVICGQYSADDDLANTITEKPNGEVGAFDIAVGQFSGSKQDIYQLYTGKASQKMYFRIGLNKEFNNWLELAYTSSIVDKAKEADIAITHKAILISGKGLNINDLNNSANVYGNIYTGLGSDWADQDNLPQNAKGARGFCLEILPNKSNTVQRYTVNVVRKMYIYTRVYDNGTWTDWQEIATLDSNGYVEKALTANNALTADNLNANAEIDNEKVANVLGLIKKPISMTKTEEFKNWDNLKEGIYSVHAYNLWKFLENTPVTNNADSKGFLTVLKSDNYRVQLYLEDVSAINPDSAQTWSNDVYIRTRNIKSGGSWSEWATIRDKPIYFSKGSLNDLIGENNYGRSFYAGGGNPVTGKPEDVDNFGINIDRAALTWTIQKLVTTRSNGIPAFYIRQINSDSVGTWQQIQTTPSTRMSTYNQGISREV